LGPFRRDVNHTNPVFLVPTSLLEKLRHPFRFPLAVGQLMSDREARVPFRLLLRLRGWDVRDLLPKCSRISPGLLYSIQGFMFDPVSLPAASSQDGPVRGPAQLARQASWAGLTFRSTHSPSTIHWRFPTWLACGLRGIIQKQVVSNPSARWNAEFQLKRLVSP